MFFFGLSLFFLAVSAYKPLVSTQLLGTTTTIPPAIQNITGFMNTTSGHYANDGVQISAATNTTYQWWYFDAVSQDKATSIVIVFYAASASAFYFLYPSPDVLLAQAIVTFANGTKFAVDIPATEAVITTRRQGASGNWQGANATFTGSLDLTTYTIRFNSPQNGIIGTFTLDSIAPPTYACGPAVGPNQNALSAPNLGWFGSIPDADGTVDFTINGTALKFTGPAYHDSNWGNVPFQVAVKSSYWGHGRLDKYSIVWYQVLAADGTKHTGGYIAVNDEILTTGCSPGATVVRPTGQNDTYPPTLTSGPPNGFALTYNLGGCGQLDVNVTIVNQLNNPSQYYYRWAGSLSGSLNGRKNITGGVALFEQFSLA